MSIARKLAFLLALAITAMAVAAPAAFATNSTASFATAGNHPNTGPGTSTSVTPAPAARSGGTAGTAGAPDTQNTNQGETYSGTETTPGTLESDNGVIITCESSDFSATVIEDGTANNAVRVDVLTFDTCRELTQILDCDVTVDTLPAFLRGDFEGGGATRSNWTATTSFEAATISCTLGLVHCEASIDSTLVGTVANSTTPGTWTVEGEDNVTIDQTTSAECGQTATWTQSWDITTPAAYTITA